MAWGLVVPPEIPVPVVSGGRDDRAMGSDGGELMVTGGEAARAPMA